MKNLKKHFCLAGGRKSGLSFAKLVCGSMLAVLLCASCASNKAVEQIAIEDEERGNKDGSDSWRKLLHNGHRSYPGDLRVCYGK